MSLELQGFSVVKEGGVNSVILDIKTTQDGTVHQVPVKLLSYADLAPVADNGVLVSSLEADGFINKDKANKKQIKDVTSRFYTVKNNNTEDVEPMNIYYSIKNSTTFSTSITLTNGASASGVGTDITNALEKMMVRLNSVSNLQILLENFNSGEQL